MNDNETELLCIGNALVDIFAMAEEGMDRQFSLDEDVQHISMERMREILTVLPDFSVSSGGGAANVAKIAGLLGIKSCFTGALGERPSVEGPSDEGPSGEKKQFDQFGRLFKKQLEESGVYTRLIRKKTPTGVCLYFRMTDGRTKIAASPSAALDFLENDLDEDLIRQSTVIVLDGFMLERQTLVRRILELADKYGTIVALDLSSAGLAYDRALEIVTFARAYPLILFMNEDEAIAFNSAISRKSMPIRTGAVSNEPVEIKKDEQLWQEITGLFKNFTANDIFPILIIKLGVRGAVVFAGGNVFHEETIPVIPLETTGAGDTFCAAFLAAWIRERPLAECAAIGNRAAREVLDVNGTQINPKTLKHIKNHLMGSVKTRG